MIAHDDIHYTFIANQSQIGFNAQVVGLDSTIADLAKCNTDTEDYWFILICSLVYFVLDRRLKDKKTNN